MPMESAMIDGHPAKIAYISSLHPNSHSLEALLKMLQARYTMICLAINSLVCRFQFWKHNPGWFETKDNNKKVIHLGIFRAMCVFCQIQIEMV